MFKEVFCFYYKKAYIEETTTYESMCFTPHPLYIEYVSLWIYWGMARTMIIKYKLMTCLQLNVVGNNTIINQRMEFLTRGVCDTNHMSSFPIQRDDCCKRQDYLARLPAIQGQVDCLCWTTWDEQGGQTHQKGEAVVI